MPTKVSSAFGASNPDNSHSRSQLLSRFQALGQDSHQVGLVEVARLMNAHSDFNMRLVLTSGD